MSEVCSGCERAARVLDARSQRYGEAFMENMREDDRDRSVWCEADASVIRTSCRHASPPATAGSGETDAEKWERFAAILESRVIEVDAELCLMRWPDSTLAFHVQVRDRILAELAAANADYEEQREQFKRRGGEIDRLERELATAKAELKAARVHLADAVQVIETANMAAQTLLAADKAQATAAEARCERLERVGRERDEARAKALIRALSAKPQG